MKLPREELRQLGAAARRRVLENHTSEHRAVELEQLLKGSTQPLTA